MEQKLTLFCLIVSVLVFRLHALEEVQSNDKKMQKPSSPALKDLIEYCNIDNVADVWFQLALRLFNAEDEANVLSIYQDGTLRGNKAKCQKMFVIWKLKTYSSWERLTEALESDAVNHQQLSKKVKRFLNLFNNAEEDEFTLSSYYGDHMVLQKAPKKASIWGYLHGSLVDELVTCDLDGNTFNAVYIKDSDSQTRWKVTFDPVEAGGPYTITCTAGSETMTISDVLFGDVWVCSGQSNMVFNLREVFNGEAEVADTANYPNVRIFASDARLAEQDTPQLDLPGVRQAWAPAGPDTVDGPLVFNHFSAVCYFYGRNLYKQLKYPIGLVQIANAGTPVESWSSPEVLEMCDPRIPFTLLGRQRASSNWNSMTHPLLNMTIFGVVWYQGEDNTDTPETYGCTFPAMIDDWRANWHIGSGGNTDEMFPFGFVQISADTISRTSDVGFPAIRWHQTADYGFAPNPRLQNVFMAVAMDLGDPLSIWGPLHPRNKQDVGERLSLAGRAIAYGEDIYHTGPIAEEAVLNDTETITIKYRNVFNNELELRSHSGFQLGCASFLAETIWVDVMVDRVSNPDTVVVKGTCPEGTTLSDIRYAWFDYPCVAKQCAIYSGNLPSPPFELPVTTAV